MNRPAQGAALLLLSAALAMAATGLGRTGLLPGGFSPALAQVRQALEELDALEARQQELIRQRDALEAAVAADEQAALDSQQAVDELAARMQEVRSLCGQSGLTGPGVRVTLTDADEGFIAAAGPAADVSGFIVHDRDLLRVVNALWSAGAESVAVNGVRLTGSDAFRCVGPSIRVGWRRLSPPFIIEAIGDGEAMAQALTGGSHSYIYKELTAFGIGFTVEISDRLVLTGREGE